MADQTVPPNLSKSVDAVLEATADLLLLVGMEPGKLFPHPAVDTTELNTRVAAYQNQLDEMELRILRNIELAKNNNDKPAPAVNNVQDDDMTNNYVDLLDDNYIDF